MDEQKEIPFRCAHGLLKVDCASKSWNDIQVGISRSILDRVRLTRTCRLNGARLFSVVSKGEAIAKRGSPSKFPQRETDTTLASRYGCPRIEPYGDIQKRRVWFATSGSSSTRTGCRRFLGTMSMESAFRRPFQSLMTIGLHNVRIFSLTPA